MLIQQETNQKQFEETRKENVELTARVSQLQSIERELNKKQQKIIEYQEDMADLELEYEIIKSKLEITDPQFRLFCEVFKKIVDNLRLKKVTPL